MWFLFLLFAFAPVYDDTVEIRPVDQNLRRVEAPQPTNSYARSKMPVMREW